MSTQKLLVLMAVLNEGGRLFWVLLKKNYSEINAFVRNKEIAIQIMMQEWLNAEELILIS